MSSRASSLNSSPDSLGPLQSGALDRPQSDAWIAQEVNETLGLSSTASYAQERLWFLERVGQGGVAYNILAPIHLRGRLDPVAFEEAFCEVVRRHDTLTTSFEERDGVLLQTIDPLHQVEFKFLNLESFDQIERDRIAKEKFAHIWKNPFDLTSAPLYRAQLLKLSQDEYWFLFCIHHIVCDGWSMGIIFQELWAFYNAYRDGLPSPLPDLPMRYIDFSRGQRKDAGSATEVAALAYWKEHLTGAPPQISLPTDFPRPGHSTLRGASVPVVLGHDALHKLQRFATQESVTLYMVVLAAFTVLLSRYAESDDIVVGTLAAGRTLPATQGLVGLFMNTLALRVDLSGDPSFCSLVGRVREVVLNGYEYQDLPFGRLIEEVRPERSLSHAALFQVLFQMAFVDGADSSQLARDLEVRAIPIESRDTAKFDLTLDLGVQPSGMNGALEYSPDLYKESTIRNMVTQFQRILEQVAEEPLKPISSLRLVGDDEWERVVHSWNQTARSYPIHRTIQDMFESQVDRTPDAPAVISHGEQTLRFADLDIRANQLAHYLQQSGVGPEVRVGICMDRVPDLLVSIFGVLKAGGAYVPLEPSHPSERRNYMLSDSDVSLLLTQTRYVEGSGLPNRVRPILLDSATASAEIAAQPTERPVSTVDSKNLCYVIYTSGSTGRPKGVAMHHAGVCNYIAWGIDAYAAGSGNGAPVFTSMAVDLTFTNLLPLFAGRSVMMFPEENPVEALAEVLRQKPDFSLIKITPTHLSLLTPLLEDAELSGATRSLIVGADFLRAETTLFWQDNENGTRLFNEYGPTETVVGCSAQFMETGRFRAGLVPVGGPISNIRFYVLDDQMEPVPIGMPGELYIGGIGVARGYLNRPGLTAEKFLPDAFGSTAGRLYKTGDRARWTEEGTLLVLGRLDNQLKVRGYRVELGEVDAVLRRHPDVIECLITARTNQLGDTHLIAYVVGRASEQAFRTHMRQHLPEYMQPQNFVMLDALPLTATGKLDRDALPTAKDAEPLREFGKDDVPKNFTEVQLIHIWEQLLEVSDIGAMQNFFDIGGNSLLALRLFAQVRKAFKVELPLTTLFDGANVRSMAEAILRRKDGGSPSEGSIVVLQPRGDSLPLFCVHPAGRSVHGYVHLVRNLGVGQPAYGVEDRGELDRPVAQIVTEHLAAIRAIQPSGPYSLLGWSFGGLLAYEMAVQLEDAGEAIAFLGLMDTMEPQLWHSLPQLSELDVVLGLASDVAAQMNRPFSIDRQLLANLSFAEQCEKAVDVLKMQGAVPTYFTAKWLMDGYETIRARHRSQEGYLPGRFKSKLTLFRPSEIPGESAQIFTGFSEDEQRTLCWSRVVDGTIDVQSIPGGHVTMGAEPHVRILAQKIREAIAAAPSCPN
ncbi:MAG: hypothetical protein JWM43_3151 [Acidobacteriaceae bacterium]|nr:hypothetical protein [Acidobacteriaceae bacterium]